MAKLPLPIKGFSAGSPTHLPADLTSGHMNNIRVMDVLEKRLRLSQRPGVDKVFAQQIGGDTVPIVFIGTVTTVD